MTYHQDYAEVERGRDQDSTPVIGSDTPHAATGVLAAGGGVRSTASRHAPHLVHSHPQDLSTTPSDGI
jgi:hypothetical protein